MTPGGLNAITKVGTRSGLSEGELAPGECPVCVGGSANVTGNNEGYKETMTWTRLPGLSRLKTQLLQWLSGLI